MTGDEEDGEVLTGGKLWSGGQRKPQRLPTMEPEVPAAAKDRAYAAFSTRDRPDALQLMRATEPSRNPTYSYLLDMSFDHHLQTALTLFYSFMVVEITGKNLGPIAHAINFRQCECITEFYAEIHDLPAAGEPLVNSISVKTGKGV
jgi:hypothetical protein